MKTFYVKENSKLSKFLLESYNGEMSFSTLNKLLRKKDIKVNGKRVNGDLAVKGGDIIDVYYDGKKVEIKKAVLFEDENVLVTVKPKGITSEDYYAFLNENDNVYFCHRLDRNTDGVMIFAKNETAYNEITRGFKDRTFEKSYRAVVYGVMDKKEDLLEAFLVKDAENSLVKVYDKNVKGSVPIKTYYRVVETDGFTSTLQVDLLTGRTHQIRAHLAHVGHFVLGDGKYGDGKINKSLGVNTLQLTSTKLVLHFSKDEYLSYLDGKTFVIG